MSETINYTIIAEGFKNKAEKKEFIKLCKEFQRGSIGKHNHKVEYIVIDGWRGGGASCEELLKDSFEEWLSKHKYIKVVINCEYVEHAPVEQIIFEKGKWKNEGSN